MNEAPKLPVPQIKESHDLAIDAAGVPSSGMTAVIAPYSAMGEGDRVTFTWQGYDADGIADPVFEQTSTLTREALGKPLKWTIPRSKISGIPGGRAEIGYQIDYATDLPKTSPSAKQAIHAGTLSPTLLARPLIVGHEEGEVLDPATFPGGLTLILTELNPEIQIGDDVVLYAKGAMEASSLIQSSRVDASVIGSGVLRFHLEPGWIVSNAGNQVQFVYQFARAGASKTSEALKADIRPVLVLPLPLVKDAASEGDGKGKLVAADASEGAYVSVPEAVALGPGDTVQMHWVGHVNGGQFTASQPVADSPRTFFIPANYVAANMGDESRRFPVFYRVVLSSGAQVDSGPFQLRIEPPARSSYPTVQCTQVSGGELSFARVPLDGADLTSVSWMFMAEGQLLTLQATGNVGPLPAEFTVRNSLPVTAKEVIDKRISAKLPRAFLNQLNRNDDFTLKASVSFNGGDTYMPFEDSHLKLVN